VVQDDHLPLRHGQGAQRLQQREVIELDRRDHRRWPQPDQSSELAPGAPQPIGGQIHGHPPHPGLGRRNDAAAPADRGTGERLLDDVLGLVQLPGHQQELTDQAGEGAGIEA
jgi:hypothetical protein